MSGTVNISRGIWNDTAFKDEPFTEREAFMWMIMEASYKPREKRVGSAVVHTERGQLATSVRFMAEAWNWSKSRVDRFLKRLENRDMIGTECGTGINVITICKYDEYQNPAGDIGTPQFENRDSSGTAAGQQRDKPKKGLLPEERKDDDALARVPEREPPGVLTFRERIIGAMGLDPATGITGPSCRVVGTQADMAEASRWLEMPGMTEDAIVAEVQRISAGRSPPNTFRYFTRAMQELSGALSAPAVVPVRPQDGGSPQQTGRPAYDPRDRRRQDAEERERRIVDAAVHGTAKGFG